MGCLSSKPQLIDFAEGDEAAYLERYLEDKVLGEGEFGVVHMVHDVKAPSLQDSEPLASKTLRKGITFKDNTIYSPLKPEVLRRECRILQRLRGQCYVLKLIGIYESPGVIHIVTEYCSGGDMHEYVINTYGGSAGGQGGLRTEDASRISYQLLCAVDHCARHGVIHRDIKPENVMFRTPEAGSELRLIDFGSSSLDEDVVREELPRRREQPEANGDGGAANGDGANGDGAEAREERAPLAEHGHSGTLDEVQQHTTFAGSAFYISPEMFQRTYTSKTDVWSAGATLYVLVAGYPSEELQRAFNLLQKSKRDLRGLPNMPKNMPDSYYEMLDELLRYRHKRRKSAGEMLGCEFARFHMDHSAREDGGVVDDDGDGGEAEDIMTLDDVAVAAAAAASVGGGGGDGLSVRGGGGSSRGRTRSVLLEGSVQRHTLYVQYEKFERSVTTLLATVLSPGELGRVLGVLNEKTLMKGGEGQGQGQEATTAAAAKETEADRTGKFEQGVEIISNERKLQIIKIGELRALLLELELKEPASMMSDLPHASSYDNFAYHIALLRQFARGREERGGADLDGSAGGRGRVLRRLASMHARGGGGIGGDVALKRNLSFTNLDRTALSDGGSGGSGGGGGGGGRRKSSNSVHGSSVFKDFRKRKDARDALLAANAMGTGTLDSSVRSQ